jgi:hypothetical protein
MKPLRLVLVSLALALPAAAQWEGVVQMKMTSAQGSGTTTAYVSKAGTKTEMDMKSAEMAKAGMGSGMHIVSIVKSSEPDLVYMVNDAQKTYSVVDVKKMREQAKSMRSGEEETFTVKKAGRDSVAGYSCEKALVTGSKGTTFEVCVSNDLGGGAAMIRQMQRRGGDPSGMTKALMDAGLDGFPVRWVTRGGHGGEVTMELVSAKKQSVPASTFEIPAGYTKSESAMPFSSPEMDKRMKEALEKMTPEQRKQFEEMMKKRSGGSGGGAV